MFLNENPCCQRILRVIVQDWNDRLSDDGARVDPFVDEVNRAPREAGTVLKRLAGPVRAGERWKQGGVDVHDPVRKRADEDRCQHSHESGKADQPNAACGQDVHQSGIELLPGLKCLVVDDRYRYSVPAPTLKAERIGFVAQDQADLARNLASLRGIYDRLEVGSATGNKNRDLGRAAHQESPVISTRSLPFFIGATSPITVAGIPCRLKCLSEASTSVLLIIRTMPIPMLNVR